MSEVSVYEELKWYKRDLKILRKKLRKEDLTLSEQNEIKDEIDKKHKYIANLLLNDEDSTKQKITDRSKNKVWTPKLNHCSNGDLILTVPFNDKDGNPHESTVILSVNPSRSLSVDIYNQ